MANLVKKQSFGGPDKQILIAEDSYKVTLGAIIGNTGVTADDDGKKILKAGTPLKGDFKARNTAFVLATTSGEGAAAASNANCVLLHDVDVTNGSVNGTIVMAGTVDLNRLDTDAAALITDVVEKALTRIIFIK